MKHAMIIGDQSAWAYKYVELGPLYFGSPVHVLNHSSGNHITVNYL